MLNNTQKNNDEAERKSIENNNTKIRTHNNLHLSKSINT